VQVRPRHAARRTHLADLVSGFHFRSRRHTDVTQVAVKGHETLTMINEYRLAVEEEVADFDHSTGCRREDGCTDWRGDVHARVRVTRLIIEDSSQSERR